MSFWREEEPAERLSQNWRKPSDTGTPSAQDTPKEDAKGTSNWPDTSSRIPPMYRSRRDHKHPAQSLDVGTVESVSGPSSRVISENGDFENKKDRAIRGREKLSLRMDQIEKYTSAPVRERSKEYSPRLLRVNKKNFMWTFGVGNWEVRVKAKFPPRGTKFDKAHLHLTCSCPFWRWQGPEHWGKTEDYQYGKPRGTASFPKIRDPLHQKAVCKHVYAVFQVLKSYRIPRAKKGSWGEQFTVSYEGLDRVVNNVVRRFLRRRHAHI